ncbi:histidine kinase [Chitinophaga niastensis]|uniref:Histidine kinase n=1 Tax=Chitinophaga niastensis TaxID=536980 RepID=A0A2P8HNZ0_CHINA|nr:histidine kinase [Chitinophaga niastensis]PSL47925.1 histidine kinase [Chitinophaga niastensis]
MNDAPIDTLQDIYKNPFLNFLLKPRMRIYRHLCYFFVLLIILFPGKTGLTPFGTILLKTAVFSLLVMIPYINIYYLVPQFLFRQKYLLYILWVLVVIIGCFCIVLLLKPILAQYRLVPDKNDSTAMDILSFGIITSIFIAASTAVKIFQRWVLDSHRINQLENARLSAELDELKSQINPHFLFNMLNNAHVLTQRDPVKASQILLKLSDLLRYQLYDSNRSQVLLSADIHFLNDFLNLEKIRRDYFDFTISYDATNSDLLIPPFLFITFVENAVKHSVDSIKKSYVQLDFERQRDKLIFTCINSKPAAAPELMKKYGRLGLANVKRRLDLQYPHRHTLQIDDHSDHYSITLTIPV